MAKYEDQPIRAIEADKVGLVAFVGGILLG